MQKYMVQYKISGDSYMGIWADSAEEAENELRNIFNEKPLIHEHENWWIDKKVLLNINWDKIDTTGTSIMIGD